MTHTEALQIVLELAKGNALTLEDAAITPELENERERQQTALARMYFILRGWKGESASPLL